MTWETTDLPDGWEVVQLGQVGTWGSGGTPKRGVSGYYGGNIPWVKISDLNEGVVIDTEESITEEGLRKSSAKLVDPGTLLVAMYGSIGKLGITGVRCATNQAIAFCKPYSDIATTEYLFYLLRHLRPILVDQGKGGTQANISQTVLRAQMIPLPPIEEQQEIVRTLETLERVSAKALEEVIRARLLVEHSRVATLAAACGGRLTEDWRALASSSISFPGLNEG